jgi:hypothetical protein
MGLVVQNLYPIYDALGGFGMGIGSSKFVPYL